MNVRGDSGRVRIGIVGCGFGRAVHVPAFRQDERTEIVAIAGTRLSQARRIAVEDGIPLAFDGWEPLVDCSSVDAVVIAAPPAVQYAAALSALRARKPVLAEKPLAPSVVEAKEICAAARVARVPTMIDFNFVELAAFLKAREILTAGALGSLRHVAVGWNVESRVNEKRFDHWKASRAAGGGALFNFVSHCFHYLEWFVAPITRLFAHLRRMPTDPRSGDTLAALAFDFLNGASGSISMGADSFNGLGHRIEFYGDSGALVLENKTVDYMRGFTLRYARRPVAFTAISLPIENPFGDSRLAPTAAIDRKFIDWIVSGVPAQPTFEDGLRVQQLLDLAVKSDRDGRRYDVPSAAFA